MKDLDSAIRLAFRVLVGLVLLTASPASAQENDPSVSAENVEKLPSSRPIVQYALAGGFLLAALAIGLKAAPRSTEQKKGKSAA